VLFVSDSGSETALVRLREPMNVLANTNVALRRCDLNAGFTEFFLNGKVEIAPATPRPERFLAAAFYKIGLTKN
jgi:hypothetical protein